MIVASEYGYCDLVKLLIEKGAEMNMQTNKLQSALFIASCNGHIDVVKLLMERGAKMTVEAVSALVDITQQMVEKRSPNVRNELEPVLSPVHQEMDGDTYTTSNIGPSPSQLLSQVGSPFLELEEFHYPNWTAKASSSLTGSRYPHKQYLRGTNSMSVFVVVSSYQGRREWGGGGQGGSCPPRPLAKHRQRLLATGLHTCTKFCMASPKQV